MSSLLTQYRLVHAAHLGSIRVPGVGLIKLADLTDREAELMGESPYLEKIEPPTPQGKPRRPRAAKSKK